MAEAETPAETPVVFVDGTPFTPDTPTPAPATLRKLAIQDSSFRESCCEGESGGNYFKNQADYINQWRQRQ